MMHEVGEFIRSESQCKLCHGHGLRVLANVGRGGQKLTTAICTGCGLVRSHPVPSREELNEYYRAHYRNDYKSTYTPKRKHILRYSRHAIRRVRDLLKFASRGVTLLDVGSGSGEFVYIAQQAGFRVTGLEPHEGYSDYTRRTFGVNILTVPLEQAEIEPESVDVITLHHVLEHLQYPLTSLGVLNGWLKMGGVLAVDVPDIETTQHSPGSRFHYAHIYNFNHATLRGFLAKSGFEVMEHPQFKGTVLFAKKTGAPAPERAIALPENYEHLWALLSGKAAEELHRKTKPLKRFLGKIKRYPVEFLQAELLRNPKRIVEAEFARSKELA